MDLTEENIATTVDAVAGVTWRSAQPGTLAAGDAWAERVDIVEAGRAYWVPAVTLVSGRLSRDDPEQYLTAVVGALQAAWPADDTLTVPDVVPLTISDGVESWCAHRVQLTGGQILV